MLPFERQVVASLAAPCDPGRLAGIERFVGSSLGAMPEHLRLGVAAESVALATWARLARRTPAEVLESLRRSPVGLLRQYERLLGSLVLFADHELGRST